MNERPAGEVLFVPLGGSGEIGMNLNLYGCDGRWLMVDLGIGFGDDTTPGIDVMVPDPTFIAERRDRLDGIVITHAHEDHLGAVALLWPRLRCPVYATPFAAAVLRRKLTDAGLVDEVPLKTVEPGRPFALGRIEVEYVSAAHSIPEAHILALRTPAGLMVHATDWKLDPEPLVGRTTDEAALRRLGDEGVRVLLCDSTNAFVPGRAGSEGALRKSLIEVIGGCRNRVAVTCFSSNIARIESIAHAAAASGRHACVVGRSLWRMVEVARETGYLKDCPPLVTEYDAGYLPPEKVAFVITGSQGEQGAALTRVAASDHPNVILERGDTVVYSSRMIPGNEVAIGKVQNQLARRGIEVIVDGERFVHVSGHPAREELEALYALLRPQSLIPIHGEARHLYEHVALAGSAGIPTAFVAENGSVVHLGPGDPGIVDRVESGRLALDGTRLVPMEGAAIRGRRRIRHGGAAVATVVVDGKGRLVADPQVTLHGVLEDGHEQEVHDDVVDAVYDAVERLSGAARRDDDEVAEAARRAVRRTLRDAIGKRPVTEVHVVRV